MTQGKPEGKTDKSDLTPRARESLLHIRSYAKQIARSLEVKKMMTKEVSESEMHLSPNAVSGKDENGNSMSMLLVDDNKIFLNRLARAFRQRDFDVTCCSGVKEAINIVEDLQPDFAVVDLKLGDGMGMEVIKELRRVSPHTRGIILTGYGNIASAVTAVKLGAVDYLAKPIDADSIFAALTNKEIAGTEPLGNPMSVDRVRWEHIQRVYEMCEHNISETARRLSMHRRTLQRILTKHAPK